MDQLIVTKWKDRSLTALLSDGHCRSLTLESGDESLLGNIYIGKVKNVVKNINAAFIDLGGGKTGYFSLAENPVPLYTDELNQLCSFEYSGNSEKKVSTRKLKAGDELLVQVSRDALKTKDPSVTCCLNFPGTYMVLTVGKPQIGFSAKIKDNAWKEKVREELLTHKDERFGLIVRTNGASASIETLCAETEKLKLQMEELFARAACRTCYSLLEQGTPPYIQSLRDAKKGTLSEIITDVPEYAKKIEAWLEEEKEEDKEQKENQTQADKNESIKQAVPKLSLYTDENLPLMKAVPPGIGAKSAVGSPCLDEIPVEYLVIGTYGSVEQLSMSIRGNTPARRHRRRPFLRLIWRRRMRWRASFPCGIFPVLLLWILSIWNRKKIRRR